jgi:hypothetical protein
MDRMRDRSNEMCNSLWKYIDGISEQINSLPEGQTKQYLQQYKSILGMIAELYVFSAVSFGQICSIEETVYSVLFKEVFGDRSITLPYNPEKDACICRYSLVLVLYFEIVH